MYVLNKYFQLKDDLLNLYTRLVYYSDEMYFLHVKAFHYNIIK